MISQPSTMTLEVVTTAEAEGEGAKGFFSTPALGSLHSVKTFSVSDLAERIEVAVRSVGEAITHAAISGAAFQIEKAEISLEITAKARSA